MRPPGSHLSKMQKQEEAAEIVAAKGHVFLRYESFAAVHYRCGRCDKVNISSVANLKQSKGFCYYCRRNAVYLEAARKAAELVRSKGHYFLRYENFCKVVFKCGVCGSVVSTAKDALQRSVIQGCRFCRHAKSSRYQGIVARILARNGMCLLEPYSNVSHLKCKCVCGKTVTAPLHVLTRGCRCRATNRSS